MSRHRVNHPQGDQVLKVHVDEVRGLGLLPRDVEILGVVTPPAHSEWVPEAKQYVFLHIRSPICFDRADNSPLTIETLYEFYDRYISINRDWSNRLESDLSLYRQSGKIPA